MSNLVAEGMAALKEAAEQERSVRFGHEAAGSLYHALVSAQEAAAAASVPEPEHVHEWTVLGWHRPSDETLVVQACSCGSARDVVAARTEGLP